MSSDKINVLSVSDDDFDQDGKSGEDRSDSDLPVANKKPEIVSTFCKNCLNPYSGAKKSGTFVLKCKSCGLTDTVLQEEASDLDADEYVGNLMMNRFLQVIREQKDMNINIGDPEFADDNFKELTCAATDFCIYLNAIAAKLLEIAKEEKSKRGHQEIPCETNEKSSDTDETRQESNSEAGLQIEVIRDNTLQEVNVLRDSVLKVIALLIAKYKLPTDIWSSIEYRLRNPNSPGLDDSDSDESTDDYMRGVLDAEDDEADSQHLLNLATNDLTIADIEDGEVIDKNTKDGETCESVKKEQVNAVGDEQKTIFGMDTERIREVLGDEIVGKLGSKFKVGNTEELENDTEGGKVPATQTESRSEIYTSGSVDVTKDQGNTCSEDSVLDREILQSLATRFKFHHETELKLDPVLVSLLRNTQCIKDILAAKQANKENSTHNSENKEEADAGEDDIRSKEEFVIENTETNEMSSSLDDTECEGLEVSFHAVSTAFMHELQLRKRNALTKRKKKAIEAVGAKLIAIKQQVRMVERQVRSELHSAYENKLRKAENQKQFLAEKQKDVEHVEYLLNHYIATGQMDKVAELMQMFQSASQNN